MNSIVATLKYLGIPVTREAYIELATLGCDSTELDPESLAEMEDELDAEEENSIRGHALGVRI